MFSPRSRFLESIRHHSAEPIAFVSSKEHRDAFVSSIGHTVYMFTVLVGVVVVVNDGVGEHDSIRICHPASEG